MRFMTKTQLFLINSGTALELVKEHIKERFRVAAEVRELAGELGVTSGQTHKYTGVLLGASFKGKVPPDFTKPKKGISQPKKGTEWDKRFKAQRGHKEASYLIADAFNIPLSVTFKSTEGSVNSGVSMIGIPMAECGFLYLGEEGPFAMWVPDVPGFVASKEEQGYIVDEPAKSFKMEFEGCTPIEQEEWDVLVAESELAEKRKALADKKAA